jgi:hypothetical protein
MTPYRQCLNAVVAELTRIDRGEELAAALMEDLDFIDWVSSSQLAGIIDIHLQAGNGPQNLEGDPIDTRFQAYLEKVIKPQIASGAITDGTRPGDYDDRKLRWSGAGVIGNWWRDGNILTLEVGPTNYQRYRQDCCRPKIEALRLMLRGLQFYGDPFAYFARTLAVTVIPITAEGSVYLGERAAHVDSPGLLNFVAGLATFNEEIDRINFYQYCQQELEEEVSILMELKPINTKLIGIAGNPFTSETDLVFVLPTHVKDSHFAGKNWSEHLRLVRIGNKKEAEDLLDRGILPGETEKKALSYASRLGLAYLVDNHF